MMARILFVVAMLCLVLQAEEARRPCACENKEEIVPLLKGIILAAPQIPVGPFLEGRIHIEKSLRIPGPKEELKTLLASVLDQPFSFSDLDGLKQKVADFYTKNHRPFISVLVPPQDLSGGILQLILLEGVVGKTEFKGNRWTSDHFMASNLHLQPGDTIDASKLKRDLAWINKNPFRQTDAFFYPGTTSGTTDVEFVTTDQIPCQPYVGADNTGTPLTERTRLYAGINAGNLWKIDQRLSYQYTVSPDWTSLAAHSGSYAIPFSWRHQLYVFGGYARSQVHLQHSMEHVARSWQASGRYQIPLNPLYGNFLQEISIGYDFKKTNNSLLFGGDFVSNKFADINQFLLGYSFDYSSCHSKMSFSLEVYGAPVDLTSHQNKVDYESIRLFAKPLYAYGRMRLSETWQPLSHLECKGLLALQGTEWNLLPSEMFGLGGYNTVRGYSERAVNADNALLTSVELNAFTSFFETKIKKVRDKFSFLCFFDYGLGIEHQASPGERKTDWLAGTGAGVRYHIGHYLLLRADVGFPLHEVSSSFYGAHVHMGMTASY